MNDATSRFGGVLQFSPAAILMLATPLLAACYTDIHGDDSSAVQSGIDEPPAAEHADAVERARPFVRAFVVEENLPGLSLAVGMAGEVVWAEGFGWADIDERRPVTPRTRFRIGGVAKPMTAAAVGLLLERGELDIDLRARHYVPSFPEKPWSFTTRQLMGHIAGIRHYDDDEEMLYRRTSCTSPLDALVLYADDPLLFEPATAYKYSSYGWTLVGAVVEAAAGEPFLYFMQREVFDPLGMGDTVLDDLHEPVATVGLLDSIETVGLLDSIEARLLRRVGEPSVFDAEPKAHWDPARRAETTSFYWPFAAGDPRHGIEDANNPDNTCLQGAAALLSTPSDVVRFGAAMLDGRLIRAETLDMLRTPLELDSGESTGHGLGWFVRQIPIGPTAEPTTVFGHDGRSAGGTTSFVTVPEHDVVITVTANVSYARNLSSLSARLADLFVAPPRLDLDGR